MKPEINPRKIVVFTGAGISAESGIATFRGDKGLWAEYPVELVASQKGWEADPELVLNFYNQRREDVLRAQPNAAHVAIAQLQERFETVVITQNVDDLHERAGSMIVHHLHGEILRSRSCDDPSLWQEQRGPISLGDLAQDGAQLRPDIVWFGEELGLLDEVVHHLKTAAKVLVVGTSLKVQPAAGLLKHARFHAEKLLVTLDVDRVPFGFRLIRGKAAGMVPLVVEEWSHDRSFRR